MHRVFEAQPRAAGQRLTRLDVHTVDPGPGADGDAERILTTGARVWRDGQLGEDRVVRGAVSEDHDPARAYREGDRRIVGRCSPCLQYEHTISREHAGWLTGRRGR